MSEQPPTEAPRLAPPTSIERGADPGTVPRDRPAAVQGEETVSTPDELGGTGADEGGAG